MLSWLFAQVGLPPDKEPQSGSFWDRLINAFHLGDIVSGAWYLLLHYVAPLVLAIAIIGMLVAGARGDKGLMTRARAGIISIPAAFALGAVAIIVGNYAIGSAPH